MPMGKFHCFKNLLDEFKRDILMEKVAHGVDEYDFGSFPRQREFDPVTPYFEVKALLEGMAWNAPKPFREPFGVTVSTTGAYLVTPCYWVPG
jgi:hypothetical protein